MATTPYAIIAGPADVYVAAVGATVPAVNLPDTDASFSTWTKLGFTEGGVKVKHTQTIDQIFADQRTGPQKAVRSAEGLEISFALAQLTLENYLYALNTATTSEGDVSAALTTALGSNKDLTYTAKTDTGTAGNLINITVSTGGGALTVDATGNAITIILASGGSTASAILAAVNADTEAGALVTASLAPGSSGAGNVTLAQATTFLTLGAETTVLPLYQGLDVGELAMLVRGPSAYMSAFCQYQVPIVVQTDSPEVSFMKDGKAILQTTWAALEDPNAASASARFGTLVAQTS